MPKICYRPKRFSAERQSMIAKANEIIEEYRKQGFELTLRQLYYQFVSRDIIANNQREYKNLGDIINDARLDALEPKVIAALIRNTVKAHQDSDKWAESCGEEKIQKDQLQAVSEKWEEITDNL